MVVLLAGIVLFGLTLAFATLLGVAKEKLKVVEDPRIPAVTDALPSANCGGCGFAGCADFAKAVVEGRAECDGCPVGGSKTAEKVAEILGIEVVKTFPYRPVIHCAARTADKHGVVPYDGVRTCAEANIVGVTQACTYGCLGFGDCSRACNFDALHMIEGKPEVDYAMCTGCGACVKACPRNLIEQIPFKREQMLVVACANKEPARNVKQVCDVGCVGCKACQRIFADLFEVTDNLAHLNYDKYTPETGQEQFAPVFAKCPAKVLVYFGEPKPEYVEQLAEEEAATAAASE
ncbi:MAG: RnfABCDGE type electron transport complex subunit B [Phycisphaerae bacterium]|jgi:RnfABCDGE-type electron transport complex B subunit